MNSNKEIIQDLYTFFKSRDFQAIRNIFHNDIEWVQMEGFPDGGKHIGPDAIFKNVFGNFSENWTNWKAVVNEYKEASDSVFAIGHYEGTYNASGKTLRAEFIHHYELQNGKVVRFQQYTDTLLVANAMKV